MKKIKEYLRSLPLSDKIFLILSLLIIIVLIMSAFTGLKKFDLLLGVDNYAKYQEKVKK